MIFTTEWIGYILALFLCFMAFFLVGKKGKVIIGTGIGILFILPLFFYENTHSEFFYYSRFLYGGICYLYIRKKNFRIP